MAGKIYVTRDKPGLGHPESRALMQKTMKAALRAEGVDAACEINAMLTDEEGIREINRDSRGIDAATDVLSFPFNELTPGEFSPEGCEVNPETGAVYLGDMVISVPRCEHQGEEFGHGYERELCYLTAHSILHLLGYDHMDEGEQKRLMRAHEEAVMQSLGLGTD